MCIRFRSRRSLVIASSIIFEGMNGVSLGYTVELETERPKGIEAAQTHAGCKRPSYNLLFRSAEAHCTSRLYGTMYNVQQTDDGRRDNATDTQSARRLNAQPQS
ncbi:hypothetical protein BD311DRAFT_47069 [Dichomitus squalens]|uniref:Uncharacterized protein n=1 Tax=Dichomitus squalens TaxID=114155 RepID=A0A4Q9MBM2_9APHY|nr:hypothetical protein BD311DRAFT_47069 [Dichomitus squalens]